MVQTAARPKTIATAPLISVCAWIAALLFGSKVGTGSDHELPPSTESDRKTALWFSSRSHERSTKAPSGAGAGAGSRTTVG